MTQKNSDDEILKTNKNYYSFVKTPQGDMLLRSDGTYLTGMYFVGQKHIPEIASWKHSPTLEIFLKTQKQLQEYFVGSRKQFDLPYRFSEGTPFQQKVWQALADVLYGTTMSYKQLAQSLESPKSVRAVASAVGKNPLTLVISCHRIIGSDGSLTGYAGGLQRKQNLLMLEQK